MKRDIRFYTLFKENIKFLENITIDIKRNGEIRNLDKIDIPNSLGSVYGLTKTDSIKEATIQLIDSLTASLLETNIYIFRNTETNKYPESEEKGWNNTLSIYPSNSNTEELFDKVLERIKNCFNKTNEYSPAYLTSNIDFCIFLYETLILPKQPKKIVNSYEKFINDEEFLKSLLEEFKENYEEFNIKDYHIKVFIKRLFIIRAAFIEDLINSDMDLSSPKNIYNEFRIVEDYILPF